MKIVEKTNHEGVIRMIKNKMQKRKICKKWKSKDGTRSIYARNKDVILQRETEG